MKMTSSFSPGKIRRTGAAMILAIITLLICSSICLTMFRTTTLRQQRFANRQWKLQSGLIADAALERAARRRSSEPEYAGETWKVSTSPPPTSPAQNEGYFGAATIEVVAVSEAQCRVKIVATYPLASPTGAQTTIEAEITVPEVSVESVDSQPQPSSKQLAE